MECPSTERPTLPTRVEEVDPSLTEALTPQDDTGAPRHPSAGVGLVALASGEDETVETPDSQTVDDALLLFRSATASAGTVWLGNWLLFKCFMLAVSLKWL